MTVFAMDTDAAWFGACRDLVELSHLGIFGWFFLGLLFGLPTASLALVFFGCRLGSVPPRLVDSRPRARPTMAMAHRPASRARLRGGD
jgi:hypothetical protein